MIRRLGLADLRQVERHFLDLSVHDRLFRFNAPLGDPAISARIASIEWSSAILIGYFEGKKLRGLAELAALRGDRFDTREVALSVDRTHRRRGIARRLLAEAALHARSLGCRRLVFWWHPENVEFARFLTTHGGTVSAHPPAGWLEISPAGVLKTTVADISAAPAQRRQVPVSRNRRAA